VTLTGVDTALTKAALEQMVAASVPQNIAHMFNVSVTDFDATATEVSPAPTRAPTPAGDANADSAVTSKFGLSILVSAAVLVGTLCM